MSNELIVRPKYELTRPFTEGPWTRFMDMHSGGGAKEDFEYILIQAPEQEARSIFFARFGHNPDRVSCTCCGEDYSVREDLDLYQATAFDRGCEYEGDKYVERGSKHWKPYKSLDEFLASQTDHLFIPKSEIKDDERSRKIPTQGFVYIDEMYDADVD